MTDEATIDNPMVEYLVNCGGKDILEFYDDEGYADVDAACKYIKELRSQKINGVNLEQQGNRVIMNVEYIK